MLPRPSGRHPSLPHHRPRNTVANSFESVRLLIADPSPMVRTGLKSALFAQGFRAITDTASYVKLHDLIEQDSVDLLITASTLEDNATAYLIQETRHHRLGSNPFVVVIMLLANAEPASVRQGIDSGADDLLLMPVAPEQLMARIGKLASLRKPFVVTHDYVGPDRRGKNRMFEHSAPTLPVPNPLRARIRGGMDGTRVTAQIRDSASALNTMQIERHAAQVGWLVNHIGASIRDGAAPPGTLITHTAKLVATAEDMIRRIKETPAEAHAGLVGEVLDIARRLDSDAGKVAYPELEKLHAMATTLGNLFGPSTRSAKKAG